MDFRLTDIPNKTDLPTTIASLSALYALTGLAGGESYKATDTKHVHEYLGGGESTPTNWLDHSAKGTGGTWNTKSWDAYGDSITAQAYWITPVVSNLGLSLTNLGVGGSQAGGSATKAMWKDANIATISATSDLITVMAGTNDWANNRPLGGITSVDTEDYCGGLNVIITKLHTQNSTGRVVFFTPPYGEYIDYASRAGSWANGYENDLGLSTFDYGEAMINVCRSRGIPCVDMGNAGINGMNKAIYIKNDGAYLHPNSAGGDRLAEVVNGFLLSISPLI